MAMDFLCALFFRCPLSPIVLFHSSLSLSLILSFLQTFQSSAHWGFGDCALYIIYLRSQLCDRLASVCRLYSTECIVAKRCALEQTLTAYRKSYMRNRLV